MSRDNKAKRLSKYINNQFWTKENDNKNFIDDKLYFIRRPIIFGQSSRTLEVAQESAKRAMINREHLVKIEIYEKSNNPENRKWEEQFYIHRKVCNKALLSLYKRYNVKNDFFYSYIKKYGKKYPGLRELKVLYN